MLTLIAVVLMSFLFAYFSTQNTGGVSLHLGNSTWRNVPLYLIALGSLLIGVIISWLISLVDILSSKLTLLGKDSTIKQTKHTIGDLTKKVHQLELENAKLESEKTARSDQKMKDKSL